MADKKNDDDWDPETGTVVPKRKSQYIPPGAPRQGIPIREIQPSDTNLGGGSRMIGRTPTYKGGGRVKSYQEGGAVSDDQQAKDYEDHPLPTDQERKRNKEMMDNEDRKKELDPMGTRKAIPGIKNFGRLLRGYQTGGAVDDTDVGTERARTDAADRADRERARRMGYGYGQSREQTTRVPVLKGDNDTPALRIPGMGYGTRYEEGGKVAADQKVPIRKIPTQPMDPALQYNKGVTAGGGTAAYPAQTPGTRAEKYGSLANGGKITGNPFAQGGPVLPRSGGLHAKNASKR